MLVLLRRRLRRAPALAADRLHRGLGPEPDSLDIHQAQGLPALQVLRDIYEGLVTFDANGRELVGGVASDWAVSDDGLEYQFRTAHGCALVQR